MAFAVEDGEEVPPAGVRVGKGLTVVPRAVNFKQHVGFGGAGFDISWKQSTNATRRLFEIFNFNVLSEK